MKTLPLGDISLETFLAEYWQKKPLLIRNAIADFAPLIEPDELAGLACEQEIESRLIISQHDDQPWSMQQGPLSESCFAELPASHWTLLVQAVDHWHPEACEFLARFNFIPQWRVDDLMISFATRGGGVGPHYDNYDVFLLQASGTRRWEYGGLYDEHSPRLDNPQLLLLDNWQAEHSVELQPGDMLYLPPKVGHNGVATSDDCVTYSVGFRAPSHTEVLQHFTDFVGQSLPADLRYSDPKLGAQAHSAQIDDSAISQVQEILKRYIEQPEVIKQWFGCYMTEHKYPEQQQQLHLDNELSEIESAIEEAQQLQKIGGTRLAFHHCEGSESVSFFVNGMCCEITVQELPFIQQLSELQSIDCSTLIGHPQRMTLLANLVKAGAYEIC
ncbi:MAG: JmjC domain-containing protein [Pseudomonadales bacterium]